jgi:hypothetical protein
MGGIEGRNPLEVVEEALAGFVEILHTPDTYVQSVEGLRAALALVRKMRADAVVGWAQCDGSAWLRGDSGWKDSYAEASPSLCRAILLPLPDSTEPSDDD